MHTLRREYAQAIRVYQELLELDGTFYKAHSSMGRALCLMERYDEALEAFETARTLAGNVPNILSALGQTLALAGHAKEARKRLKELQALADKQWVPSVCFAILYLGLGEYHDALNWLEAATERREIAVTALKVHPMYDPLRAEPRFATLLTRIKFLP
jgi:serine/threonine-protein kinase